MELTEQQKEVARVIEAGDDAFAVDFGKFAQMSVGELFDTVRVMQAIKGTLNTDSLAGVMRHIQAFAEAEKNPTFSGWKNVCDSVADALGLDIITGYTPDELIKRVKKKR